jgi:hypothetical protein
MATLCLHGRAGIWLVLQFQRSNPNMQQRFKFTFIDEDSKLPRELIDKLNTHPEVKTFGVVIDPATFCPMARIQIDDGQFELIEEILTNGFVIYPEYKQSTN